MTEIVRPIGAQDPREVLDWGVDWATTLSPGEAITTITWTARPEGIGLVITPLDPVDQVVYVRLEVAPAQQSHSRWERPGVIVELACEVATTDQREIVRVIPIRMARGVRSPRTRVIVS